jgi:hypothetical protein
VNEAETRAGSECLGQSRLTQNRIGGVAASNAHGNREFRRVSGLCQISWLPLPCRTRVQPAARSRSRNGLSNCGAIQAAAGSASRSAVIWRNSDAGSTPG